MAVVVSFFICWLPFHAQRILAQYLAAHWGEDNGLLVDLHFKTFYISGVLYYLSPTINPILYQLMSAKFRLAFRETFNCSLFDCLSQTTGQQSSPNQQLQLQLQTDQFDCSRRASRQTIIGPTTSSCNATTMRYHHHHHHHHHNNRHGSGAAVRSLLNPLSSNGLESHVTPTPANHDDCSNMISARKCSCCCSNLARRKTSSQAASCRCSITTTTSTATTTANNLYGSKSWWAARRTKTPLKNKLTLILNHFRGNQNVAKSGSILHNNSEENNGHNVTVEPPTCERDDTTQNERDNQDEEHLRGNTTTHGNVDTTSHNANGKTNTNFNDDHDRVCGAPTSLATPTAKINKQRVEINSNVDCHSKKNCKQVDLQAQLLTNNKTKIILNQVANGDNCKARLNKLIEAHNEHSDASVSPVSFDRTNQFAINDQSDFHSDELLFIMQPNDSTASKQINDLGEIKAVILRQHNSNGNGDANANAKCEQKSRYVNSGRRCSLQYSSNEFYTSTKQFNHLTSSNCDISNNNKSINQSINRKQSISSSDTNSNTINQNDVHFNGCSSKEGSQKMATSDISSGHTNSISMQTNAALQPLGRSQSSSSAASALDDHDAIYSASYATTISQLTGSLNTNNSNKHLNESLVGSLTQSDHDCPLIADAHDDVMSYSHQKQQHQQQCTNTIKMANDIANKPDLTNDDLKIQLLELHQIQQQVASS